MVGVVSSSGIFGGGDHQGMLVDEPRVVAALKDYADFHLLATSSFVSASMEEAAIAALKSFAVNVQVFVEAGVLNTNVGSRGLCRPYMRVTDTNTTCSSLNSTGSVTTSLHAAAMGHQTISARKSSNSLTKWSSRIGAILTGTQIPRRFR